MDRIKCVGVILDLTLAHEPSGGKRIIDLAKTELVHFVRNNLESGVDCFYLYRVNDTQVCYDRGQQIASIGNYESDGWAFNIENALKQTLYVLQTESCDDRFLLLFTNRLRDLRPLQKIVTINSRSDEQCHIVLVGIGQEYNADLPPEIEIINLSRVIEFRDVTNFIVDTIPKNDTLSLEDNSYAQDQSDL